MIEKKQRFSQFTAGSHQNEHIRNWEIIIDGGDDYHDDRQIDGRQTER